MFGLGKRNRKNLLTVVLVYPDDTRMAKSIITKSLKEPTDKSGEGLRIIIARFRPRYFSKDSELTLVIENFYLK